MDYWHILYRVGIFFEDFIIMFGIYLTYDWIRQVDNKYKDYRD